MYVDDILVADRYYSHETVADNVVWPLVSALWPGGEWRQNSEPGDDFSVPMGGSYKGRSLRVTVEAECQLFDGELDRYANLIIKDRAHGEERSSLIKATQAAASWYREHKLLPSEDSEEVWSWPECDEGELIVYRGAIHMFDARGEWGVKLFRQVIGDSKVLSVPLSQEETTDMPDMRLRLHDLEDITAACRIFNAPGAIMRAIDAIKARPIEVY